MKTAAVQYGPAVLKAMPINQKTNLYPLEQFDLSEKMPKLVSVQHSVKYRMAGVGQILDLSA